MPQDITELPHPLDLNMAFSTPPPPLQFVLRGLLPGTVGAIVAPGGTGKSFLGVQIACALATGHDSTCSLLPRGAAMVGQVLELGDETLAEAPSTAYLAGEDPRVVLWHRFHAVGKSLSPAEHEAVADRVYAVPAVGSPISVLDRYGNACQPGIASLRALASSRTLLIVDTLRRLHSADENDSGAMTEVITILESIAQQTTCSIVFMHHANKFAGANGKGDEASASRGSSAITDNVRWQLNLSIMTETQARENDVPIDSRILYVLLTFAKSNYEPRPGLVWLKRDENGLLVPADFLASRESVQRPTRRGSTTIGDTCGGRGMTARDRAMAQAAEIDF